MKNNQKIQTHRIREHPHKGMIIEGINEVTVQNIEMMNKWFNKGEVYRTIG